MEDGDANFGRIAQAINFLRAHHGDQPGLADLAHHLGLSESRTQRLFSRWAGISPKRFVQFLTVESVKRRMADTASLLDLSLGAGLSGPGRLHDLFVALEAMSPGEFRRAAQGVEIRYGTGPTPFGRASIGYTGRGICHLSFIDGAGASVAFAGLRDNWPAAHRVRDDAGAAALLARVFDRSRAAPAGGLSLWVSGTNFQIQVWRALLQVPFAGLLSYAQLAQLIGRPQAARAVGSAMAHNPVAYLIPCHRVLRGSGDFGSYHWGNDRKTALCAWEAAADETESRPPDAWGRAPSSRR